MWVVNPDADSVAVIDARAARRLALIPVGRHPRTLAIAGSRVAVACQDDGTLHLLDAEALAPRAVVRLGDGTGPYGVVADPRGGRVLVTLQAAGGLAVIDPMSGARTAQLDVGGDVRGVAINARGQVLLTRWRARDGSARLVYVEAVPPDAPRLVGELLLPTQSQDHDNDGDNSGVPSFLDQVLFSPDGGYAVVPALKANVVTGRFRTGRDLTGQTTARGVLITVDLPAPGASALPVERTRYPFDDLDMASAAAFSAQGARLLVALRGAQEVQALDAFSHDVVGTVGSSGDGVGVAPAGLALSSDGHTLWVDAFLSRSVRAWDVSDLSREPTLAAAVATLDDEPLSPQVLHGKRIFYSSRDPRMSRTRYLSCASCHLDGEGDDLVWDFTQRGEGLRNTIPLNGRGGTAHGHGLLHWSANFDEVQDFEHDIRGGQGGTGFLDEARFHMGTVDRPLGDHKQGLSPELDALAAYVNSLDRFGRSPARRDDAPWLAACARGKALFEAARTGCSECHRGPALTDSGFAAPGVPRLHDVGTLGAGSGQRLGGSLPGIDTPTLRGLWKSAPYLHDGSAATLREVLTTHNPGDRHGRTSGLTPDELTDLEIYLLSLDDEP